MTALEHVDAIQLALKESIAIMRLMEHARDVESKHVACAAGMAGDRLQSAQERLDAMWDGMRPTSAE